MSDENRCPLRRSMRLRSLAQQDLAQFSNSTSESLFTRARPLKALIDQENEMSENEKKTQVKRSRNTMKPGRRDSESSDDDFIPEPRAKHSRQSTDSEDGVFMSEHDSEQQEQEEVIPKSKKARQSMQLKTEKAAKKASSKNVISKPTAAKSKAKKETAGKAEVDKDIDEFDALDLPELNAPREWMNLLGQDASASKDSVLDKNSNVSDGESSESDWDEIAAPVVPVKKPTIKVHIETKIDKEKEEEERQRRIEAERKEREFVEDCHKIHFLVYLCHLRYQMVSAKEFCKKYKDELNDLIDFDLYEGEDDSLADKFEEFCKQFTKNATKNELCKETSKEDSVKRLYSILKTRVVQSHKDLIMALVVLLLSENFQSRLCIGFTPEPDLPWSKKIVLKKNPTAKVRRDEDECFDSDEFERKPSTSKAKKESRQVAKKSVKLNYWAEYFDESNNEWIPIHPGNKKICEACDIEKYAPFSYAFGIDSERMNVINITGWYASEYLSVRARKSRLNDVWISAFLAMPLFCPSKKHAQIESQKLLNYLRLKPMPKIVSEFKDHPLYALDKDLLKFEAIYPPDVKPLGMIRNYNIYPRNSVFTLQGELNWIRQARSVKKDEEPYKVVTARPKLSIPAEERVPLPLNTYGYWQTEPYVPPKVVDGKIGRNEFGNVYMYQPQMVPDGCVHLRLKGVLQMAKSLGMEAAPAVVGWEFTGGRNHPIIEGCVVLKNDADVLKTACIEWMQIRYHKRAKNVESHALHLWKRFVKGKLLLQKMKKRFNVE